MFHLLCVTERGIHLSIAEERVEIRSGEDSQYLSLEDLDAVLLEESAISLTGAFLAALADARIPVVLCDRKYLPSGTLCPVIREGAEHHTMLSLQMQAGAAWKKRLWRQLIRAKISGQAANLRGMPGSAALKGMLADVLSGDARNAEARAAALYWKELALFPKRDRQAPDANRCFNYAYAVLYAAFARHLCAAALEPHIGIHHHGQYNPFSLASDLMEPYRPLIDRSVIRFLGMFPGSWELDRGSRGRLLEQIYAAHVRIHGHCTALPDAVPYTVHSYKRCLREKSTSLLLPEAA